ncbi:MAG TPA: tetratricopeptide repeat protein, partial [Opitutales bacterium]|nr:tetratricopeptide repeat protein [Opitutales bacterium]
MFNATLKRTLFILLIATTAWLAGCSSPEEKRARQIEQALELSSQGANEEAIEILEALTLDYPNDAEILQAIGRIYASEGDHTLAAFYLEQAHLQDPDNVELLYQTYQSLEAADRPVGANLEKLAELSPETMSDELWIKLGAHRADNNEVEAALDAYLKGVDPEKETPAPETAVAIGQLFAKLNNYAQASDWLEIAADNDDPSALSALFGLLQIQLSQKNWAAAEATVTRLNKQFPGAVEASEWKQASEELKRWRAAQEEMKAKLAAAEEAKRKAAEAAEKEAAEAAQTNGEGQSAEGDGSTASAEEAGEAAEGGKSQVISDAESAEALADKPAEEADAQERVGIDPDAEAVEVPEDKSIAFNPSIAIEPADPDFDFSVSFDEQASAPTTTFRVEPGEETAPVEAADPLEALAPVEAPPAIAPAEQPKTLEELLAEAEAAETDRDYKSAIRKYWAAISIANNRAEVWNRLSRAYLIDGQLENADTAALEAVRLSP